MKKILITGKDSYIGLSLEKWLNTNPERYQIDTVDVKSDSWRNVDFSSYDVVFHVAGIAHVSTDPKMKDLYFKVNRDLTIQVASKAKESNVKQFIFMSSIIVYGDNIQTIITKDTKPHPSNFYGESKLQAEQGIRTLETDAFKIAILRPPMIYGKNSRGNYPKLSKLAQITPVFPNYPNTRSMLHIDNLSQFLKLIIDNEDSGLFYPQNKDYVQTSDLVAKVAKVHNKKIMFTVLFNPIIKRMMKINLIQKIFGDLVYDQSLSKYDKADYHIRGFMNSIELTEGDPN